VLLAGLDFVLYPISRQVAQISTAPDALIEPATALIQRGENLYSVQLSGGSPVSPGPGWILLNAPFTISGFVSLLTPFYLFLCALMISKWSKAYTFGFIILLFVSLSFLQMSFVGHDLPATILAFVGLTLALYRYYDRTFLFVLISFLIGVLSTARVPFIIFPIALSLCLRTKNQHRALLFVVFSTSLALLIHLVFYLWAVKDGLFYQPLHIFNRAALGSGLGILIIGGITWAVAGWFAWRRLTSDIASWFSFLWVLIGVPFIFVGFGELIRNGIFSTSNWAAWEGKVYVMFTLPLMITSIVMNLSQRAATYAPTLQNLGTNK
jgi:hypothetical protein